MTRPVRTDLAYHDFSSLFGTLICMEVCVAWCFV